MIDSDIDLVLTAMSCPFTAPGKLAYWRKLLFLRWQVPLDALRLLVPDELTLDVHDGAAYVGVVPFVMRDIRPRPPSTSWKPTSGPMYIWMAGC